MKILAALLPLLATCANAQDFPGKPIRLIVTTAPGGPMDVPGHLLADWFEKAYGQRVLAENRGGAGGVLGGDTVAKAAPDGYTLGLIQVGNVAINPFTVKDTPFDPLNDFAPVAPLSNPPVMVAIDAKIPVNNLREFIEFAKREGGGIHYGTAGLGTISHLAAELFADTAGVKLTNT
jgi:tripartite-type tricarboxylate transporter receptor subunit TctC